MQGTDMLARMREFPTSQQMQFYDYVRARLEMTGVPPTSREMAKHFELSLGRVSQILHQLKALKLLTWEPRRAGTLRIVAPTDFPFLGRID